MLYLTWDQELAGYTIVSVSIARSLLQAKAMDQAEIAEQRLAAGREQYRERQARTIAAESREQQEQRLERQRVQDRVPQTRAIAAESPEQRE